MQEAGVSPHLIERVTRLSLLAYFAAMALLVCAAAAWVLKAIWSSVTEYWAEAWRGPGPLNTAHLVALTSFLCAGVALSLRGVAKRQVRGVRRSPRHPCPTCGYDLRATPTRCPECGRAPWHRR